MSEQDTTFEEAKRCPKCQQPGKDREVKPAPGIRGATVHTIYCENQRCNWYNTPWMVQVNQDGSVPPPSNHRGEPKIYQGFEGHDDIALQIVKNLQAQAQLETREGGYEIPNPRTN